MSGPCPFDYSADGDWILCSDGAELLVHDGRDEAPLWSDTLPAPLVGVAVDGRRALALDSEGTLRVYPLDEQRPGQAKAVYLQVVGGALGTPARALAVGRGADQAAVLTDAALVTVPFRGQPRKLATIEGCCLAVAPLADQIAVGTPAGDLKIFQAGGLLDANLSFGRPIGAVTWSPAGHWIAAAGDDLLAVTPTGERLQAPFKIPSAVAGSLAASADGVLCAWRADEYTACVAHWGARQLVGRITYERTLGQVSFGPGRWLGIGLSGGDGNKIELASLAVHRTDTFPHRQHNSWVLIPEIDTDLAGTSGPDPFVPSGVRPVVVPGPTPAGGLGNIKRIGIAILSLAALGLAAWLMVERDEHRSRTRRENEMREEIRDSIQRSVKEHMRSGPSKD